jgi:hypothetical protein
MRVPSFNAKVLYVLGKRYTDFSYMADAEGDARSDVNRLKHKILRRLSNRGSFVSWQKTQMMLRLLKNARKEFRQLEERLSYEQCCIRKRAAYARADQDYTLAGYIRAWQAAAAS